MMTIWLHESKLIPVKKNRHLVDMLLPNYLINVKRLWRHCHVCQRSWISISEHIKQSNLQTTCPWSNLNNSSKSKVVCRSSLLSLMNGTHVCLGLNNKYQLDQNDNIKHTYLIPFQLASSTQQKEVSCFYCKSPGHVKRNCQKYLKMTIVCCTRQLNIQ